MLIPMAVAWAVNEEKDALRGIGSAPGLLKVSVNKVLTLLPWADDDLSF